MRKDTPHTLQPGMKPHVAALLLGVLQPVSSPDSLTSTQTCHCLENLTLQMRKCAGNADLVLWNPWVEKSKGMGDFGDEEFNQMVCVETVISNEDAVELLGHLGV